MKKSKQYKCEICGQVLALRGFGTHARKHGMTSSEYWKKYNYTYDEPVGEYGVDYVLCPICNNNRMFQSLSKHIKDYHKMDIAEFIEKYPNSKIQTTRFSNYYKKQYKEKNSEWIKYETVYGNIVTLKSTWEVQVIKTLEEYQIEYEY